MNVSAILAGVLLCHGAVAGPTPTTMTKFVVRAFAPEIPPESFQAKPKTYYIADGIYARVEEELDAERGTQVLHVFNGPDFWDIDLSSHTGRHFVDPGPSFGVHLKLLPSDAPKEIADLELGKEHEYFRAHNAASIGIREIDGRRCEGYQFQEAGYRMVLYLTTDSAEYFQLEIYRAEKLYLGIRFLSYKTKIPFDAEQFKPPEGVTMTEAAFEDLKAP